MKVSILQENLNKGLTVVSRIITSRSTLPILSNILMTGEEGKLKLTTTNLEISINYSLPAKKEKEGKFTVPAKDLTEFVSSLKPGKIDLEVKQEKFYLKSQDCEAIFNGLSAQEFPAVPSLKDKTKESSIKQQFTLEVKEFIEAVQSVCFSASIDEARPILTGVRLSFADHEMQLVATDGYRLSLKKIKIKEKVNVPVLIIPGKALMEVVRIIQGGEENENLKIAITKETNQIIFSFREIEIVARLIEGEFPDFEKIIPIPSQGEGKALIGREELAGAVKASAIFSRKSANIVKLGFSAKELVIRANAPELGENQIKLAIEYQGEPTEIAFNYRFLQEFLANFNDEVFSLEISGALKPGLFKSKKDNSYLHIIMPVRIQSD